MGSYGDKLREELRYPSVGHTIDQPSLPSLFRSINLGSLTEVAHQRTLSIAFLMNEVSDISGV
jgi:hypothetical protein